jgi:hypothetical protein
MDLPALLPLDPKIEEESEPLVEMEPVDRAYLNRNPTRAMGRRSDWEDERHQANNFWALHVNEYATKMHELAMGVMVEKQTREGNVIIYQEKPDLEALKTIFNRLFGNTAVRDDSKDKQQQHNVFLVMPSNGRGGAEVQAIEELPQEVQDALRSTGK